MAGLGDMSLAKAKADTEKIEAAQKLQEEAGPFGKIIAGKGTGQDLLDMMTPGMKKNDAKKPSMSSFIK